MAGRPANLEVVVQGADISFDATFRAVSDGPPVDPDAIPTWIIYDPLGAIAASGDGRKIDIGVYMADWSAPIDATPSELWKIVWTAVVGGQPVLNEDQSGPAEEFFVVLGLSAETFSVDITDFWLRQIKRVLGAPAVDFAGLYNTEIVEFSVFPAMMDYFNKFPLRVPANYPISGALEIPFPDANTFGIVDARVTDKQQAVSGSIGSTYQLLFYNALLGNNPSGGRRKGYRFQNFRGTTSSRVGIFEQRRAVQALQNILENSDVDVNEADRKVIAYSSTNANLYVVWAKFSLDFTKVLQVHKQEVLRLAQAYYLDHVADLNMPVKDNATDRFIDVEALRERAEKLRDPILERWGLINEGAVVRFGT